MRHNASPSPQLLATLYEASANPDRWPDFLGHLSASFNSDTATLRLVDVCAPVIHSSYIIGFDAQVNRRYEEDLFIHDPFQETLNTSPPGLMHCSHGVVSDAEYERTLHYQMVMRPNGNFYAMGGQVERNSQCGVQVGIHRARRRGPFQEFERLALESLSPHLQQAAAIARRLEAFESALRHAYAALDRLPFGIWLIRRDLHCDWMNAAAEANLRGARFGLRLNRDQLSCACPRTAEQLRRAVKALNHQHSTMELIRTGAEGTLLLLAAERGTSTTFSFGGEGILAFLFDTQRPVTLDPQSLYRFYGITAAETRLVSYFVQGRELRDISQQLGISVHTARAQLKSVMQKLGARRQADLMRKLLLMEMGTWSTDDYDSQTIAP